jgi:hypothetical protein
MLSNGDLAALGLSPNDTIAERPDDVFNFVTFNRHMKLLSDYITLKTIPIDGQLV